MPSLYTDLSRLRLNWYVAATAHAMRRHWQLLVIASLALPSLPVARIPQVLAFPVVSLLHPGQTMLWYSLHVVLIQAIALLWSGLQRKALATGPMTSYLSALPIPRRTTHLVNATILLFADSLILLPIASSLLVVPMQPVSTASLGFHTLAVATLALSAFAAQIALLEQQWHRLLLALLGVAAWGWSLVHLHSSAAWATQAMLFAVLVLLTVRTPALPLRRQRNQAGVRRTPVLTAVLSRLPIAARIQLRILFEEHWPPTVLRLAIALGIAGCANFLFGVFNGDVRTLPAGIIAGASVALILSGIYRTLAEAHASMQRYAAALPLAKHFWLRRDLAMLSVLAALPFGVMLLSLFDHGIPATTCLKLALANLGLLMLLRLPLSFSRRQTALVGVMLAGGWSAGAMVAIH
jgi:hypothetical protein